MAGKKQPTTNPQANGLDRALESRDLRSLVPLVQDLVRTQEGARVLEARLGASAFHFHSDLQDTHLDEHRAERIAHELAHVVQQRG